MKKFIIGFLILFVIVGGFSLWFYTAKSTATVYESESYTVSLESSTALKTSFRNEKTRTVENTVDVIRLFDLDLFGKSVGTYEIVERTLGNGNVFLFERMQYDGWIPLKVNAVFAFHEEAELQWTDWNPIAVEHPHHDVFGVDPTINPFGRVTTSEKDLLVGHTFISTQLERQYDNGKESVLRELQKESRDVTVDSGTIVKAFTIGRGELAESWSLVSDEPLFTSGDEEAAFIDFALHNQESQLNWLTIDGPYTKLPFSIDPATKMGYGRAIGRIEDDVALDWFGQSASVFFESMVLNSRVNLQTYIGEFDGTRWPTEYTSTWLNNAYGVKAPYVDTRYNEYVAFFLDQTAELFKDEVENPALYVPVYADYLLSRVEAEEIIETENGYLIVDYFDEDPSTSITHASLNHELGGLKILLSAYGETGEDKYLTAAESVIAGIQSFGAADGGWIRDNGDLWYQARPDGTFSGDDYPQLTLVDLLETQKLLEDLALPRVDYFDDMIASKLTYLEDEGLELIEKVTRLLD